MPLRHTGNPDTVKPWSTHPIAMDIAIERTERICGIPHRERGATNFAIRIVAGATRLLHLLDLSIQSAYYIAECSDLFHSIGNRVEAGKKFQDITVDTYNVASPESLALRVVM